MSRFLAKAPSSLLPYTPGEQPQDKQYIKLNTNESPFSPSPKVLDAISQNECKDLRLYSDPDLKSLSKSLAEYYGLETNQVICSNGSDEVLSLAFFAWGTDCGVAFADITYGFYPVFSQFYGIDVKIVPLKEDFSILPQDYYNCGRMVVIANPNAPTGLLLSVDDIEKIALNNPDNVVVVDEAYIDFGGNSALPLINKYKNILVVRTFSKSRQLAGARLGFAMGDKELIADLNRLKFSFNPYNVNRLTAVAGKAAIEDDEWFNETRLKIIDNRNYTTENLRKLGFDVIESSANFVFAKSNKIDGEKLYLSLKEKGILVRHFGLERIKDYVRITIGDKNQMEALISAIKKIL